MKVYKTAIGPVLAASLLGCSLLAACAKNDGPGTALSPGLQSTAAKGGSTSAGGSTAGASAAAGSSASTSLAGSGGAGPAMPAPCGAKVCGLSTLMVPGLTAFPPCCVSAAEGTCGWLDRTSTCVAPPPADADCPKSARGQTGCCVTATDRCGVDASMFGAGCYDLNSNAMFADPVNNPPRTCEGMLVEEEDGGMLDTSDGGTAGMSGGTGGVGASGMGGAGGATAGSGGSAGSSAAAGKGSAGAGGRGGFGRAGSFAPPRAGRFAPPLGGRFAPSSGGHAGN